MFQTNASAILTCYLMYVKNYLSAQEALAEKLTDIFGCLKYKLEHPTSRRRYIFVKALGNIGYRKYDDWLQLAHIWQEVIADFKNFQKNKKG